ncbi:hypothetical protein [Legionella sp. CNM-4043-24]|uniref:hypothetical protein n=1 Tax=Legionella sp. CNM-4043-24 TaxID=3421646 RepID=UPI00403AB48B
MFPASSKDHSENYYSLSTEQIAMADALNHFCSSDIKLDILKNQPEYHQSRIALIQLFMFSCNLAQLRRDAKGEQTCRQFLKTAGQICEPEAAEQARLPNPLTEPAEFDQKLRFNYELAKAFGEKIRELTALEKYPEADLEPTGLKMDWGLFAPTPPRNQAERIALQMQAIQDFCRRESTNALFSNPDLTAQLIALYDFFGKYAVFSRQPKDIACARQALATLKKTDPKHIKIVRDDTFRLLSSNAFIKLLSTAHKAWQVLQEKNLDRIQKKVGMIYCMLPRENQNDLPTLLSLIRHSVEHIRFLAQEMPRQPLPPAWQIRARTGPLRLILQPEHLPRLDKEKIFILQNVMLLSAVECTQYLQFKPDSLSVRESFEVILSLSRTLIQIPHLDHDLMFKFIRTCLAVPAFSEISATVLGYFKAMAPEYAKVVSQLKISRPALPDILGHFLINDESHAVKAHQTSASKRRAARARKERHLTAAQEAAAVSLTAFSLQKIPAPMPEEEPLPVEQPSIAESGVPESEAPISSAEPESLLFEDIDINACLFASELAEKAARLNGLWKSLLSVMAEQQRNANTLCLLDNPDEQPDNPIERFVLRQQELDNARILAEQRELLDQEFGMEYHAFNGWINQYTRAQAPALNVHHDVVVDQVWQDYFVDMYEGAADLQRAEQNVSSMKREPGLILNALRMMANLKQNPAPILMNFLNERAGKILEQAMKQERHLLMDALWRGFETGDALAFYCLLDKFNYIPIVFPELALKLLYSSHRAYEENNIMQLLEEVNQLPPEKRNRKELFRDVLLCEGRIDRSFTRYSLFHANMAAAQRSQAREMCERSSQYVNIKQL